MHKQTYKLDPDSPGYTMVTGAISRKLAELKAAGEKVEVVVQPPKRGLDQSAKFHALCGDVSKQLEWAGSKRDSESWKRLFLDAWARETNRRQVEYLPSLDGGNVVLLGIQSRSMSKKDMSELIEWTTAWAVSNGVRLTERGYD